MKRHIVGIMLVLLVVLAVPLMAFGAIKMENKKSGAVEYESNMEWKFAEYYRAEAKARNVLTAEGSRKFLKIEFNGLWKNYIGKVDRVEYLVNGKPVGVLVEEPRYHVSEYGREITIYFSEDGIRKIAALSKTDKLTFVVINTEEAKSSLNIPTEVLEEWLTVYHSKLQ